MNGFLLDTNTISELVAVKPEPRVLDWMEAADENLLYLSLLTLGEIRQGVASLPQSKKRTRLETWLEVDLQTRFAGRVLLVDGAAADRWGWIMASTNQRHDLAGCGRTPGSYSPPAQSDSHAMLPILPLWISV